MCISRAPMKERERERTRANLFGATHHFCRLRFSPSLFFFVCFTHNKNQSVSKDVPYLYHSQPRRITKFDIDYNNNYFLVTRSLTHISYLIIPLIVIVIHSNTNFFCRFYSYIGYTQCRILLFFSYYRHDNVKSGTNHHVIIRH